MSSSPIRFIWFVLAFACTTDESENISGTSPATTSTSSGTTSRSPTWTTRGPPTATTGSDASTSTGEPTTTGATTEAPTTGAATDETGIPDDCQLPVEDTASYYFGNASFAWDDPVDEPCTVASSMMIPDGYELRMDCPIHAGKTGGEQVTVTLVSGPMPGVLPQVGDTLHVFYQFGGDDFPQPGLLFLRSGEQLLYFAVNGVFVYKPDIDNANKQSLPLMIDSMPGRCPLLPNPAYMCEGEALSVMSFTGDGPPLLLSEGMSGTVEVADLTYAVDVRLARHGEGCRKLPVIDRQTVAGALLAP